MSSAKSIRLFILKMAPDLMFVARAMCVDFNYSEKVKNIESSLSRLYQKKKACVKNDGPV